MPHLLPLVRLHIEAVNIRKNIISLSLRFNLTKCNFSRIQTFIQTWHNVSFLSSQIQRYSHPSNHSAPMAYVSFFTWHPSWRWIVEVVFPISWALSMGELLIWAAQPRSKLSGSPVYPSVHTHMVSVCAPVRNTSWRHSAFGPHYQNEDKCWLVNML